MKRVFIVVLDSCGIGAAPDAEQFGDSGSDTLRHVAASPSFSATTLCRLGLGHIDGIDYLEKTASLLGAVGRFAERSMGKDTTIGHWELAGVVSPQPLPTYPDGFPDAVIEQVRRVTGRGVLCNRPYSGTQVIGDYGEQHMKTGDLIVYTSADSVFQIAAHESVVPPERLYEICRAVREVMQGEHAVGRVIARPFVGRAPHFTRTANRRDFSLQPPKRTLLDAVMAAGQSVVAVGKISDIFAGRGVTRSVKTHSNQEGMQTALSILQEEFCGLCMVNLVDFDMLYGHRQDVDGYAAALAVFDMWLPSFLEAMGDEDMLIITADHGCDPADCHTDHTREYIPMVAVGRQIRPCNLGTRTTFADIGATAAQALGIDFMCDGHSFWNTISR